MGLRHHAQTLTFVLLRVSIAFTPYPTYLPIDYSIHAFLALRCILRGLDMVTSRGLVTYQVGNIPNQTIYSELIL